VRDTLLVLLEGHDLHVVGLASATEGWEALEREPPDLLVVDLDLPGVGGLDLCRAVRTDPRWQRLPMLVLTARDDPSAVVEAFEAGADDYVPKPVVGPELEARIFSHLERSHLHRELADTDPLTGLQNRRQSELTITRLLRLAGRRGETLAFAILDLDRFKGLNDRWGHLAGDAVLRRVGALLTSSLRGEDVVARWGGEEFAIGLTGMTAGAAARRLESLLGELKAERFDEAGAELVVSFSAGVAEFPRDGETLERLYSAADQALFRAKASRSCILTADG
jgi:diguanylate cyclase (GGDEF)-like protein